MAYGRKTGGRKKGSVNKRTTELGSALEGLMKTYEKTDLIDDFNGLPPTQRIKTYEALLAYFKPKLKQIDNHTETTLNVIQFALPVPHTGRQTIDIDTITDAIDE